MKQNTSQSPLKTETSATQPATDRQLSNVLRPQMSSNQQSPFAFDHPAQTERPSTGGQAGDSAEQSSSAGARENIRSAVAHEEVARRAHELWEQDGCPDGRHEQHWAEAEKQLRGTSATDAREDARAIKASAERRASGAARN
jgi:hypothetical protein